MPVILGQICHDRYKHGKSDRLIGSKEIQKVFVFKEAHRSVNHVELRPANASGQPREQFGHDGLTLVNLQDLDDLQQLREK